MNHSSTKTAFYLKINRNTDLAFTYLERWIQIAYLFDRDCYIICDDKNIAASILDKDILYGNTSIIESISEKQAKTVAQRFSMDDRRLGAALAHMTTFYHSQKKGYDFFWNIDADDTLVCLSIDRIKEMLEKCEEHAKSHAFGCLSLDMWRTIYRGSHWSFGITFTSNEKNWIKLMEKHSLDEEFRKKKDYERANIDSFFSYLRGAEPSLKIDAFYFENLTFVHDSGNMMDPVNSAVYHWSGGELHLPLVEHFYNLPEIGAMHIADDIIRFEMGIESVEAINVLRAYAKGWHKLSNNIRQCIDYEYLLNPRITLLKQKQYIRSRVKNATVVLFGAGKIFHENQLYLREGFGAEYIVDNNPVKWGEIFEGGIRCISPEELCKIENVFVIITLLSKQEILEVKKQLKDMGIKHYYSFLGDNFTKPSQLI